jgi:nitroimidazol reductase NimA-like FMN-containing flavoprotein (pyridoxamine 5'-phosphate oxidase superfamily)
MEPVKLPWMDDAEIGELVKEQRICRIAINGEEYPYLAPFRYIVIGDTLYFHFTDYGRKVKLLEKNRKVCVQIERYQPDLSSYRFVSLRGELEKVDDPNEYKEAVLTFSETGKKVSTKFLAAHGLDPSEGWESFSPCKQFIIMKLKISEEIGLKSP